MFMFIVVLGMLCN